MTDSGYWLPHSSSVEFCEPNYLLTHWIAEPHNVWSSLCITGIGLIALIYSNPLNEVSTAVMYGILAAIGLGSAALHATLHWLPQSSDEVPMLWQVLSFLYVVYLTEYPDTTGSQVGFAFAGLAILQTIVYYRYQEIYAVFIASMTIYTIVVVVFTTRLWYTCADQEQQRVRWFFAKRANISYVCIGVIIWIIDMNLCDHLLPYYYQIGGLTLHVVWHISAAMGSYFTAALLAATRAQQLGHKVRVGWKLGLFPTCELDLDEKVK